MMRTPATQIEALTFYAAGVCSLAVTSDRAGEAAPRYLPPALLSLRHSTAWLGRFALSDPVISDCR